MRLSICFHAILAAVFVQAMTAATLSLGAENTAAQSKPTTKNRETPTTPSISPLADIVPEDEIEAGLLAHPEDSRAHTEYAVLLSTRASASPDPTRAQALRRRARAFAVSALSHGSAEPILQILVTAIRPDGTMVESVHSDRVEVNALMKAGEEKFGRRDFDGALADYLAAWKLAPDSDRAALFIGDVFFSRKEHDRAIEWFDRAIAIAPGRETAHRYRADALMQLRRYDDARDGYIHSIIADPYNGVTRSMLPRWASQTRRTFKSPDVKWPSGQLRVENDKYALSYNPSDGALSLAYLMARVAYLTKQKINPVGYRHSLAEESTGLRDLLAVATELAGKDKSSEEPSKYASQLTFLRTLVESDLLEAHILLDRADQGIAQDYPSYRATHSERLTRYIRTVWLDEK